MDALRGIDFSGIGADLVQLLPVLPDDVQQISQRHAFDLNYIYPSQVPEVRMAEDNLSSVLSYGSTLPRIAQDSSSQGIDLNAIRAEESAVSRRSGPNPFNIPGGTGLQVNPPFTLGDRAGSTSAPAWTQIQKDTGSSILNFISKSGSDVVGIIERAFSPSPSSPAIQASSRGVDSGSNPPRTTSNQSGSSVTGSTRLPSSSGGAPQSGGVFGTVTQVLNSITSALTPIVASKQQKQGARPTGPGKQTAQDPTTTYVLIGGGILAVGLIAYVATKD